MKLWDYLKKNHAPLYNDFIHHKFGQDLVSSVLPTKAFYFYLYQDNLYLKDFIAILNVLQKKAKTINVASLKLNDVIKSCKLEEKAQQKLLDQCSFHFPCMRSFETLAYTSYMYEVAFKGDYLDLLIAITPCAVGYVDLVNALPVTSKIKEPLYQDWVSVYQTKNFQAAVGEWSNYVNNFDTKVIGEIKLNYLKEIFAYIVKLEIAFFDQTYELKHW